MGRTQPLAFPLEDLNEDPELLLAQGRTDHYSKKEMAPSVLHSQRKAVVRGLCRWKGFPLEPLNRDYSDGCGTCCGARARRRWMGRFCCCLLISFAPKWE